MFKISNINHKSDVDAVGGVLFLRKDTKDSHSSRIARFPFFLIRKAPF